MKLEEQILYLDLNYHARLKEQLKLIRSPFTYDMTWCIQGSRNSIAGVDGCLNPDTWKEDTGK